MLRVSPAEAQSGGAADPRQEGRDRARPICSSRSKRIARDVKKCLESAIANAENNHDLDVDESDRRRGACRQGAGDEAFPRRAAAAASGEIFKPFRNLTIVVRQVEAQGGLRRDRDGSEGQSDRPAARHQPDLGFALVSPARTSTARCCTRT